MFALITNFGAWHGVERRERERYGEERFCFVQRKWEKFHMPEMIRSIPIHIIRSRMDGFHAEKDRETPS